MISDLHQSKVYLLSGLFEIVTQTNHIPLLVMKDCSQITMTEIWKANPLNSLNQFKNIINKDVQNRRVLSISFHGYFRKQFTIE